MYRDAALQEWEAGRPARQEQLEAAGQSGFHNPRVRPKSCWSAAHTCYGKGWGKGCF